MRFADVLAALRSSHDRLAAALGPLSDEQVSRRSYADEWTIAQVASHLGSGAEIFRLIVDAGLKQSPAPGPGEFHPVWDLWNGKDAPAQARDAVIADAAFLDHVAAVGPAERDAWQLELFGMQQTLPTLLQMRLCEHAVHTWDIVVALDPSAAVAADAAGPILGLLPGLAARAGKGASEPLSVHVTTTDPDRGYRLELAPDHTALAEAAGPAEGPATLRLPAEALIRLVYGRLDPDHTPPEVVADGVDLDVLRRAFPGF
jgi:uncharacterized protein (TIGR03083 family)